MASIIPKGKIPSSFRDPSGFLFFYEEQLYRQINNSYKDNYDLFMDLEQFNYLCSIYSSGING